MEENKKNSERELGTNKDWGNLLIEQMPSDKEITCVKNHLGVFDYFAVKEKTADLALPCEICKYCSECDHRHGKYIAWVYEMNEDKAVMYGIGKYVANKKITGYALPSDRQTARIVAKGESEINSLLSVMLRDKWILIEVMPTSDGSGRSIYRFYKDTDQ